MDELQGKTMRGLEHLICHRVSAYAVSCPFFVQISSIIVNLIFFLQNATFCDFICFSSKTNLFCA